MGPVALVLSSYLSRSSLFCLAVVALEDDFLCTSGTPGETARAHGGLAERVRASSKKYPKRVRKVLMSNLSSSDLFTSCYLLLGAFSWETFVSNSAGAPPRTTRKYMCNLSALGT